MVITVVAGAGLTADRQIRAVCRLVGSDEAARGAFLDNARQRALRNFRHLMRHDAIGLRGALHDRLVRRGLGKAQPLDRDRRHPHPVIHDDGVRMPSVSIERLRFAEATPYETVMKRSAEPDRVMSHEVAEVAKRALTGVVQEGTARRLIGTYKAADGTALPVGGKTGTGDNRYHHFGAGGGITGSRVVDRTGTFVFFLGDRFFGTVTAYVPGPEAARFSFTSGLAVQLLKVLEPELRPLISVPHTPDGKPVADASQHS